MRVFTTEAPGTRSPCARVNLIGGFELLRADGSTVPLTSARARGIVACLLLAVDGRVSRDSLCEMFWGDRGESQARSSLRQSLFEIRGALNAASSDALQSDRDAVRLEKQHISSDVHDLAAVLDHADPTQLTAALAAIPATLLDDLGFGGSYQDWHIRETARLERALAASVHAKLEVLAGRGKWTDAGLLAEAWLRIDPLDEGAVAIALRADRATGANATAQRRYVAFKDLLTRELAIAPGPLVEAAMSEGAAGSVVTAKPEAVPATISHEPLLAVLAFDNLSADPGLAYLCDGVADEIQRTVAQGTALKVVARTSSFQFRGTDKNTTHVAAALGATHLLDGSVRKSGDRVRISAELVDCATHSAIWSDRYDGDLDDVFSLQDRIASEVAKALKVQLAQAVPGAELEPAVYELLLRARSIVAEGDPQFDDSAVVAVPLLEQVVAAASGHAPAWELLAGARAWQLRSVMSKQPYDEGHDGVVEAAETALRLDPSRTGAYVALAMLEPWGAYAAREKLLNKAIGLAPRDPVALTEMSNFCWSVGRFRDALHFAELACELNPLMPAARLHVAQMRTYVGDYETSIRMLEELHARWPDNHGVLLALLDNAAALGFREVYDRAIGDIKRFEGRPLRLLQRARGYQEAVLSDDPQLKAAWVEPIAAELERAGTLPLNYIVAVGDMGMAEQALAMAERSSYEHIFEPAGARPSAYYPGTIMGPWSTILKSPRFIDLCVRLGLCSYWMRSGTWPDCAGWTPYDFKAEVCRVLQIPVGAK